MVNLNWFRTTGMIGLVLISSGLFSPARGYIYVKAAPSGPQVSTTSSNWVNIPDLSLSFFQYQPGNVCIGFSAESYVTSSHRMFVRVLVDGQPARPSDVVFTTPAIKPGTHSFQFAATVGSGLHQVTMQYSVDYGGTASLGDRTMYITTAPTLINTVAAPSGPDVISTSGSFVDIPDMSYTITLPGQGDVVITLTGEAETLNNKRMFLRALLDGQPAFPSDVVLSMGSFTGTHAFTFVAHNITAGSHLINMQWKIDSGGTAAMGDRTLTIAHSNDASINDGLGGIYSVSAPSGPQISTTSSSFTSVSDLQTTMFFPENATAIVSLTSEAYTIGDKRMFLRATVDGLPMQPSDVVFTSDTFLGTCSFNFVAKNLSHGNHQISLEWLVDGGGTAEMGDRNLTIMALPTPCPDLTEDFNEIKPVIGDRPLLVICWDPHRPDHPAPTIGDVRQLIFGSHPSVRDYFTVNSHNLLFVNDVGMKGWYDADKPWDHYWAASDPTDADGDGWISGHVEKWAEAIRKADHTFDYAAFDANGDGNLEAHELGILIVIPQNSPFGTNRIAYGKEYPSAQPLVVDGVTITWIAEAYIGSPLNLGLVVHELSHLLLHLPDMYFNFFFPYAAGMYSIMDVGYYDNHIDPFHKIRMGWIQPAIVIESSYVPIDAVETSHIAYILHDPSHGNREYFIVENRQPGISNAYDSALPDAGLAVWHIMEDPNAYQNLSAPAGVDPANWATISAGDWGRRAIRMIRPVYGPPFDNRTALWDGSDPLTGYNLLSDDPNPDHATLRWHDGTPSGFAIRNISTAAPHMEALIEVPWMPIGVQDNGFVTRNNPVDFVLEQNYPNPFNPETMIPFRLPENSKATVSIYNLMGQRVKTLISREMEAGRHTISWDGKDDQGREASSGIYFYQVRTAAHTSVKKMILAR